MTIISLLVMLWMRSDDYHSRGWLLAILWLRGDDHRLCIPIIHISKITLGTVGDAGDA